MVDCALNIFGQIRDTQIQTRELSRRTVHFVKSLTAGTNRVSSVHLPKSIIATADSIMHQLQTKPFPDLPEGDLSCLLSSPDHSFVPDSIPPLLKINIPLVEVNISAEDIREDWPVPNVAPSMEPVVESETLPSVSMLPIQRTAAQADTNHSACTIPEITPPESSPFKRKSRSRSKSRPLDSLLHDCVSVSIHSPAKRKSNHSTDSCSVNPIPLSLFGYNVAVRGGLHTIRSSHVRHSAPVIPIVENPNQSAGSFSSIPSIKSGSLGEFILGLGREYTICEGEVVNLR